MKNAINNSQGKKMKITVKIKNSFGTERIYPSCENAQKFASLAGTKTLSRSDIMTIKALGFAVEVETAKITTL